MEGIKTCPRCGITKPYSEYHCRSDRRGGKPRAHCKSCTNKTGRRWVSENKEHAAYLHKMKNIEKKYGLHRAEYADMLVAQNNQCLLCLVEFTGFRGRAAPAVDHDHKTGAVRALLCIHCNQAIGLAHENPSTLRRMAAYVEG